MEMIFFRSGCFDWLHPSKKQDLVEINLPGFKKMTLTFDYGLADDFKNCSWDEGISNALRAAIKGTLWAPDLDTWKKALEWIENEENETIVYNAWRNNRSEIVKAKIKVLQDELKRLEAT